MALLAYPHFVVVAGAAPTEDPTAVRAIVREIVAMPGTHPALRLGRSGRIASDRVEVDTSAALTRDNKTNYSRTDRPMSPHTDGSFLQCPPDLVAFQMVQSDATGGESIVVAVEDALAALGASVNPVLSQPLFPFGKRCHPVLWRSKGAANVRYYRSQIDVALERLHCVDAAVSEALEAMDAAIEDSDNQFHFRLEPGEVLFVHNTRALHGRTALNAASRRLMLRTRAHAVCLA